MKDEKKIKVYDALLRVCHAGIGILTTFLILSAYAAKIFSEHGLYRKSLWVSHALAGHALIAFLLVRFIWGLIGPASARWSSLLQFARWKEILSSKQKGKYQWGREHHPMGALAALVFYLVMIVMSVSGVMLSAIEHNIGPLAEKYFDQVMLTDIFLEFHDCFSYLVIGYIFLHIFALLWHERNDQVPVIQRMFSGVQNLEEHKEEKHENHNQHDDCS